MKRSSYIFLLALLYSTILQAQLYTHENAHKVVSGAEVIWYNKQSKAPAFIKFGENYETIYDGPAPLIREVLGFREEDEIIISGVEKDNFGGAHFRYQQYYKGIPVEAGTYIAHYKEGKIRSLNGVFFENLELDVTPVLTRDEAFDKAQTHVGAEIYKWQMPEEIEHYRETFNDPDFSYDPGGTLYLFPVGGDFIKRNFKLVYKFDIYAHQPESRSHIYVDAKTGEIIGDLDQIHMEDVVGTAKTKYSGDREIITDSVSAASFRLRESKRGQGNGMITLDLNSNNVTSNAEDFWDDDNYWNNVNAEVDEAATDAHWGAEMMYDYLMTQFNRNSVDNNGFRLVSYVHYSQTPGEPWQNASWNGSSMRYGDGNGSNPFTGLFTAGHEIGHGVTGNTARLIYQTESGALNESFSDIFGGTLLLRVKGGSNSTLGGRLTANQEGIGRPGTYLGQNWYVGDQDNGGVHTNSGVQNKWYYILVYGHSGTNSFGESYSVDGIGLDKAEQITYRNLTVYLTSSSQYEDAQFYSIQAASDLYGECSEEVVQTAKAWSAVNVGDPLMTPDLNVFTTSYCSTPVNISFQTNTVGAQTFKWHFGDGTTSTEQNPCHEYTDFGTYDIKLVVTGCGIEDSLVKTEHVKVEKNSDCLLGMPADGEGCIQTACTGTLFDNGLDKNYLDNRTALLTIAPPDAAYINLAFKSFSFEENMDFLRIYNGLQTTASNSIGSYTGNNLPDNMLPGIVISDEGTVTLRQSSDQAVNGSGFELNWYCVIPGAAPEANFTSDVVETCTGVVSFKQVSGNNPAKFLWDFGDGTTSTAADPVHTYGKSGVYDVKLIVTNKNGSDSIAKESYITIIQDPGPQVTSEEREGVGSVTLLASGGNGGPYQWYDAQHGGNLVHVGDTFVTPALNQTTMYYVQDSSLHPIKKAGPPDDGMGVSASFNSEERRLFFDVYEDLELKSVLVFANGDGERTFQILDNRDTVIYESTVEVFDGPGRVTLNASIPKGTGYQIKAAGTNVNLKRNSSGASYPYTLKGLLSITGSDASQDGYYYFFYDWEIQQKGGCVTERMEAVATVTGLPDDPATAGIRIFPNPAQGFVNIEVQIDKERKVTFELYDVLGKEVYEEQEKSPHGLYKKNIDLSGYVSGVYFLKIKIGDRQYTQKLVKK